MVGVNTDLPEPSVQPVHQGNVNPNGVDILGGISDIAKIFKSDKKSELPGLLETYTKAEDEIRNNASLNAMQKEKAVSDLYGKVYTKASAIPGGTEALKGLSESRATTEETHDGVTYIRSKASGKLIDTRTDENSASKILDGMNIKNDAYIWAEYPTLYQGIQSLKPSIGADALTPISSGAQSLKTTTIKMQKDIEDIYHNGMTSGSKDFGKDIANVAKSYAVQIGSTFTKPDIIALAESKKLTPSQILQQYDFTFDDFKSHIDAHGGDISEVDNIHRESRKALQGVLEAAFNNDERLKQRQNELDNSVKIQQSKWYLNSTPFAQKLMATNTAISALAAGTTASASAMDAAFRLPAGAERNKAIADNQSALAGNLDATARLVKEASGTDRHGTPIATGATAGDPTNVPKQVADTNRRLATCLAAKELSIQASPGVAQKTIDAWAELLRHPDSVVAPKEIKDTWEATKKALEEGVVSPNAGYYKEDVARWDAQVQAWLAYADGCATAAGYTIDEMQQHKDTVQQEFNLNSPEAYKQDNFPFFAIPKDKNANKQRTQ